MSKPHRALNLQWALALGQENGQQSKVTPTSASVLISVQRPAMLYILVSPLRAASSGMVNPWTRN
jgi:hypothetical protein